MTCHFSPITLRKIQKLAITPWGWKCQESDTLYFMGVQIGTNSLENIIYNIFFLNIYEL